MKKSELKNIIKECVKEVIFEEGVLSGIITEVAQGLQGRGVVQEQQQNVRTNDNTMVSAASSDVRSKVLSAVGNSGYEHLKNTFADPSLFEGTKPLTESKKGSALAGTDPNDPGISLDTIPGLGNSQNWAAMAAGKRR